MAWWSLSSRTTITDIIGPINKVIVELDHHARSKTEEAEYMETEALHLQDEAAKAHYEAHRASVLSKTLRELVTNDDDS